MTSRACILLRRLLYFHLVRGRGLAAIVEAMACGTPVVTSNVSCIPEIAGEAALLVDPEDVQALAGAMDRIAFDDTLRDGQRSRKGWRGRLCSLGRELLKKQNNYTSLFATVAAGIYIRENWNRCSLFRKPKDRQ